MCCTQTSLNYHPQRINTHANQEKYCRYHQNYGQTTEDRQTLNDKIEGLIQLGHLQDCIKKNNARGQYGRGRGRYVRREYNSEKHNENNTHNSEKERKSTEVAQTSEEPLIRGVINTIAGGYS